MRHAATLVLALGLSLGLAGCGFGASERPASLPVASVGPATAVTGAVAQTRGEIATALASISSVAIQFADATRAYRPPESGRLRDAARAVYQVFVPDRPDSGYIVVYEFPDAAAAVDAGNEEAGFLGTGPARVNFPRDAQHVLRQVGTTLILYSWSPSDTPDRTPGVVAAVLATLGIGFTVPN
ncbi:MAG: hypothetical protein ABIZ72_10645 [Candidatus Limnocylindrales bacterium]